jgi:hypothetical protein
MMPTRTSLGLLLAVLTLALSLFSPIACYNPSIQDGGFLCAEAGKQCPDGFTCQSDGHCRSIASTKCPVPAITPLCIDQPVTGAACNPTCQTGCSCGRCNVFGSAAACVTNLGTLKLGDVCDPASDKCQPGYICLLEADTCGHNVGRCYQYCTTNAQCVSPPPAASRTCEIPILDSNNIDTKYRTCSLGSQTCNPMATTNNGCPNAGLGCYVNTAGATFCDCPNRAMPVALGGVCTAYNDCATGLICTPSAGLAGTHCRQTCLTSGTNTCPSGQHCVTVAGGYGYCLN